MKFDICIDKVFLWQDFLKSMEQLSSVGIRAYEFWKWWQKDVEAILEKQTELGMECVTFCTKFITLLDPTKRQEYKDGLKESITAAKQLGAKMLISQVGYTLPDTPRESQLESIVLGIRECVPLLEESGVTLIIEPLNTLVDHPGYFLDSSKEAFSIIDEVASPNVKILYDIYHFQVSEGNLINTITDNFSRIGHFHCAGNPGRGEITKGEINYKEVFKAIKDLGYEGWVGLECNIFGDREKGIREAMELFGSVL